ncbi:FadR/GntR family transcriptional regulator [Aureimonas leprariae]|uniref:FadR family transcriptional regulator n=1 Tax=Plantimonas leprariae TaxID=2615207 RepID=A0A7V7PLY2_9HYPH|nr:FadR/GntR family transcriptional regulator [Aureimonas leprariae]KAB0677712.1 FadR family transcriptional regulator [Aureimonas leprariae]
MGEGRRISGGVAHRLGTAIVTGRLSPGTLLDGEIEASNKLAVSRGAYREALRVLAAKGLVESRTKTGTRVTPRSRWRLLDPDVLGWFFETAEPDIAFIRALFELRQIVEPSAAALAAERRGAQDLARLKAAVDAMERFTFADERGRQADRTFHDAILRATGNEILANLGDGIGAAVRWTTLFKARFALAPRDPVPEHRGVFDAIAAGDGAEARARMAALVDAAQADIEAAFAAAPAAGVAQAIM